MEMGAAQAALMLLPQLLLLLLPLLLLLLLPLRWTQLLNNLILLHGKIQWSEQSGKATKGQNDEAATEGAHICIQEHTPHTQLQHTNRVKERERERGKTHRDNMLMQINCLLTLFKFPIRHTWRGGAGGRLGRQLQRERKVVRNVCSTFLLSSRQRCGKVLGTGRRGLWEWASLPSSFIQEDSSRTTSNCVCLRVCVWTMCCLWATLAAAFCNFNFDFNLCWNIYIITDWQQAATSTSASWRRFRSRLLSRRLAAAVAAAAAWQIY